MEFRAHPAWQRIIVVSAGVAMNIVLAAVLFAGVRFHVGEEIWRTRTVGVVAPQSAAAHAGIVAGDEIVAVDGHAAKSWNDLYPRVLDDLATHAVAVTVRRGGAEMHLTMPADPAAVRGDSIVQNVGLYPDSTRPVVVDLSDGMPAARGGMEANDVILTADSVPVYTDGQLITVIRAHAGRMLAIDVRRADGVHRLTVKPSDSGKIGIAIANVCLGPKDTVYSLPAALSAGVEDVGFNFQKLGGLLVNLVTGRASVRENLGGPIAIAKMAGRTAERGLSYLFLLMASLSISLAGLNILPVPALDGGHLLFIVIEGALHREVSHKVKIAVQQVGFALLLLLMTFVVFNDLRR